MKERKEKNEARKKGRKKEEKKGKRRKKTQKARHSGTQLQSPYSEGRGRWNSELKPSWSTEQAQGQRGLHIQKNPVSK